MFLFFCAGMGGSVMLLYSGCLVPSEPSRPVLPCPRTRTMDAGSHGVTNRSLCIGTVLSSSSAGIERARTLTHLLRRHCLHFAPVCVLVGRGRGPRGTDGRLRLPWRAKCPVPTNRQTLHKDSPTYMRVFQTDFFLDASRVAAHTHTAAIVMLCRGGGAGGRIDRPRDPRGGGHQADGSADRRRAD